MTGPLIKACSIHSYANWVRWNNTADGLYYILKCRKSFQWDVFRWHQTPLTFSSALHWNYLVIYLRWLFTVEWAICSESVSNGIGDLTWLAHHNIFLDYWSCVAFNKLCMRKVAEEIRWKVIRIFHTWRSQLLLHVNDEFYDYQRISSATFLMQSLWSIISTFTLAYSSFRFGVLVFLKSQTYIREISFIYAKDDRKNICLL